MQEFFFSISYTFPVKTNFSFYKIPIPFYPVPVKFHVASLSIQILMAKTEVAKRKYTSSKKYADFRQLLDLENHAWHGTAGQEPGLFRQSQPYFTSGLMKTREPRSAPPVPAMRSRLQRISPRLAWWHPMIRSSQFQGFLAWCVPGSQPVQMVHSYGRPRSAHRLTAFEFEPLIASTRLQHLNKDQGQEREPKPMRVIYSYAFGGFRPMPRYVCW